MPGGCSMVSGNVINHSLLSALHNELGAVHGEYGPTIPVQKKEGSKEIDYWAPQIEKAPQASCVWRTWQCAEWVHRAFLHHYHSRTLQVAFQFYRYNFHLYGMGSPRNTNPESNDNIMIDPVADLVPIQNARWSINLFAFQAGDLANIHAQRLSEDDESQMAYVQPFRMNKPACAVGSALVVHFSYGNQEEGLVHNTDLLNFYRKLADESQY